MLIDVPKSADAHRLELTNFEKQESRPNCIRASNIFSLISCPCLRCCYFLASSSVLPFGFALLKKSFPRKTAAVKPETSLVMKRSFLVSYVVLSKAMDLFNRRLNSALTLLQAAVQNSLQSPALLLILDKVFLSIFEHILHYLHIFLAVLLSDFLLVRVRDILTKFLNYQF